TVRHNDSRSVPVLNRSTATPARCGEVDPLLGRGCWPSRIPALAFAVRFPQNGGRLPVIVAVFAPRILLMRSSQLAVAAVLMLGSAALRADEPKPLKVGIIGLDTSHVSAFTGILNAAKPKPEFSG